MTTRPADDWRQRGAATRRARSERRILDAARGLFGTLGYDRTSVEAIAVEAGVGPATVYQRYGSKAVVATAVCVEQMGDLETPAERDIATMPVGDAVQRHLERLAAAYNRHRALAQAMFEALSRTTGPPRDSNDPRLLFPLPRPLALILQRAQERGELSPEIDVNDVAGSLTSFLMLRVQSRSESARASATFVTKAAFGGLIRLSDP